MRRRRRRGRRGGEHADAVDKAVPVVQGRPHVEEEGHRLVRVRPAVVEVDNVSHLPAPRRAVSRDSAARSASTALNPALLGRTQDGFCVRRGTFFPQRSTTQSWRSKGS